MVILLINRLTSKIVKDGQFTVAEKQLSRVENKQVLFKAAGKTEETSSSLFSIRVRQLADLENYGATIQSNLLTPLVLGGIYALIAVGYTMVYGIIQLINFAHGEIFMFGAYLRPDAWLQFSIYRFG